MSDSGDSYDSILGEGLPPVAGGDGSNGGSVIDLVSPDWTANPDGPVLTPDALSSLSDSGVMQALGMGDPAQPIGSDLPISGGFDPSLGMGDYSAGVQAADALPSGQTALQTAALQPGGPAALDEGDDTTMPAAPIDPDVASAVTVADNGDVAPDPSAPDISPTQVAAAQVGGSSQSGAPDAEPEQAGTSDKADTAGLYPDPQKDTININGKVIPRLQAALNVKITDDEANTILDAVGGDPVRARAIEALLRIENVGNGYLRSDQTSSAGASGPLQITPAIWKHYARNEPYSDVSNLGDAARVASRYMDDVESARHTSDPAVAAADYIGGPKASTAVAKGEIPAGPQTQQYVRMMRGLMRDMPVWQYPGSTPAAPH